MLNNKPRRGAVDLDSENRTKSGLHSLLMMLIGAVIAVMFGVFLYLSPFFDVKPVQIQPEVAVEPLPQAPEYEFYDVLPEQEFRSVPEGVSVQSQTNEEQSQNGREFQADTVVRDDNQNRDGSQTNDTAQANEAPAGQIPTTRATPTTRTEEASQAQNQAQESQKPSISISVANPDSTYILQIRSYTEADLADQRRAEVIMAGVDAEVVRRSSDGQTIYQVISTPLSTRDAAMTAYKRLQNAGIDAVVVEQKHQ